MEPFFQIIPDPHESYPTLVLNRKTGSIPKGSYSFVEYYCTDPDCDCRRVLLLVFNENQRQKAVISFGFDQEGAMAGPYLDSSHAQSRYAPELLDFFVQSLNSGPEWLDRLYRRYRLVREVVQESPYRGKPFPKPGKLRYVATPPPDLEAEIEQSLKQLRDAAARLNSGARVRKRARLTRPKRTDQPGAAPGSAPAAAGPGMAALIARYAGLGATGPFAELLELQQELLDYLLAREDAGRELAALLPALCQRSPEDDERIDAALRLLFDALDLLQREVEERRPGAKQCMERLQSALAQQVFLKNEDLDLCAAVTTIVVQSGAEVLPVLREAHSEMLRSGADRTDLRDVPEEEALAGITRCLESMGLDSPFDGAQSLLELFVMNEPDIQIALTGELLQAENPMLREISALMLFNPEPEVRLGVSQLLAALDGRDLTPETLRRLIVCRNWFPEEIRKNIDQAISCARRARVECAPLAKAPAMTVYASPIDGSGTQSFQVLLRDGKKQTSCSLLLKQGGGVTDAFVIDFRSKGEANDFLDHLGREAFFIRSSQDHLDQRICQALADGIREGSVPNCWLVRIAELLGKDRWLPAPLDPAGELDRLREELAARAPRLLSEREYLISLQEVEQWHRYEPIFASWFEDHHFLALEIETPRGTGRKLSAAAARELILSGVLEKRREIWLERILVHTLWLKSWKGSPFPWHRMFHVACVVADRSVPLGEIPLMRGIAQLSYQAYQHRAKQAAKTMGP